MLEREIKLQVPDGARAAVRAAVQGRGRAPTTRLQAVYADSADARLAAAGLALRLRKEGRHWVQALKGRGDGLLQRIEHEVPVPSPRGRPLPDPARHDGTPAGEALRRALGEAPLQVVYTTDIRRTHRLLRHRGATIEIAWDEGRLEAGGRFLPVSELELELKDGDVPALLDLAGKWALRHGLWLDVRTKSERGQRLARDLDRVPAVKAQAAVWAPPSSCAAVAAASMRGALAQALPNAAELAAGTGAAEHLHQLRVGLRRLRSALRLFGPWFADPGAALALEAAWRPLFARLGSARDADVVEAAFGDALRAAGAPELARVAPVDADVGALLRDPPFTQAFLQALALAEPPPARAEPLALRPAAAQVLQRAWRQAMREAPDFATAEADVQHRLRKRLKRLRYGIEFLQPLWPAARAARQLRVLCEALDELGHWNDLSVAEHHFRARTAEEPGAWFAVGWLAARRPRQLRRCTKVLHRLGEQRRCWKG